MSSKPLKVAVRVDKVVFDPSDDSTQRFNEDTVVYQVYQDYTHVGNVEPKAGADAVAYTVLEQSFLDNPKSVMRVIAKDAGACFGKKYSNGVDDDLDARVGTISFNIDYFKDLSPQQYGVPQVQKVTMFDDCEDDDFDGEFGEDDEELPMIQLSFVIEEHNPAKPAEPVDQYDNTPSPQKISNEPTIQQAPVPEEVPQMK